MDAKRILPVVQVRFLIRSNPSRAYRYPLLATRNVCTTSWSTPNFGYVVLFVFSPLFCSCSFNIVAEHCASFWTSAISFYPLTSATRLRQRS